MEGTMKALIFKDKGNVVIEERPIPECGDDGIIVKVAYCGICGSDIHAYTKGGMYGGVWKPDHVFGHEFSGIVVEVGKNVKDIKLGDRVWVDPNYNPDTAHSCMCGGFAEYAASQHAVKDETVFVLPEALSLKNASLIEPFGVGVHTKNRATPTKGDKILMFGAGPIGLMAWSALKHQGIDDIIIAERMPSRIALAKELGAHVFDNTDADPYAYAGEQFGLTNVFGHERSDIDYVIDCVGVGAILGEFLEKGRGASRFSTLGLDQTPLSIKPGELMSKQFTIFGSRAYEAVDIKEVIDVLVNGEVDITRIVTGVFDFADYEKAFEAACDRNTGMKVLISIDPTLEK